MTQLLGWCLDGFHEGTRAQHVCPGKTPGGQECPCPCHILGEPPE